MQPFWWWWWVYILLDINFPNISLCWFVCKHQSQHYKQMQLINTYSLTHFHKQHTTLSPVVGRTCPTQAEVLLPCWFSHRHSCRLKEKKEIEREKEIEDCQSYSRRHSLPFAATAAVNHTFSLSQNYIQHIDTHRETHTKIHAKHRNVWEKKIQKPAI